MLHRMAGTGVRQIVSFGIGFALLLGVLTGCNTGGGISPELPPVEYVNSTEPVGRWEYDGPVWEEYPLGKCISVVILEDDEGNVYVFDALSNVYAGQNRSVIRKNGKVVYPEDPPDGQQGYQETITLFIQEGVNRLFGVPEHGRYMLVWNGQKFVVTAAVPGQWCTAGGTFNGRPVAAFNDAYGAVREGIGAVYAVSGAIGADVVLVPRSGWMIEAEMQDKPVLVDVESGEKITVLDARTMIRCFLLRTSGALLMSGNFGRECLIQLKPDLSQRVWDSPALSLAEIDGKVIGGHGIQFGPAHLKKPDGRVSRWQGEGRWLELFDTGCAAVMQIVESGPGELLIVGANPDRLYEYQMEDGLDVYRAVHQRADETPKDQRSFGANVAVTKARDVAYVAWSDEERGTSRLYRFVRRKVE